MHSHLIELCRYYKGEEDNAFEGKDQNKSMFWFYERAWVNFMAKTADRNENGRFANNLISEYLTEYTLKGLTNFSFNDGVPITFKALLFNRYQHWSMGDAEGFKEFYIKEYLGKH